MLGTLRLQLPAAAAAVVVNPKCDGGPNFNENNHCRLILPLKSRRFTLSLSLQQQPQSGPIDSSDLTTSTVGSSSPPPIYLSQSTLTRRHIHILNFVACAAAISATWLFCSAIPALLAFRRAAISMEKLMDVTREELPDTMAAIRLSGMELSDLTMELSDLSQGFTKGVRSSTRAVRSAEEKLRQFTNTSPSGGGDPRGT
ncbi:OLC1v1009048C2 [Oldenlandia corymbosa var. corymbosa]|uniref:OLC1v1009048C2 n=2 Tax=Oldenlandia corymbosa var. corymbosa TaxID=529605 RepID=A0AAV1DN17_OLDCO|nr:OLC1v1009048C2 [Oldenlandia corymbosa var. corymbosa]